MFIVKKEDDTNDDDDEKSIVWSMLVTYKNKSVYKSHLIDINVLDENGWTDGRGDEEIIFINNLILVEIEGSRFIGIYVR
jgi:hypothetical protein